MDNRDDKISFMDWLATKGVIDITEYDDDAIKDANKGDAGVIYTFSDERNKYPAKAFMDFIIQSDGNPEIKSAREFYKYYKTNISYGADDEDDRLYINTRLRNILYKAYMKEVHPEIAPSEKQPATDAINKAKRLLQGMDVMLPDSMPDPNIQQKYRGRLTKMTQLLRNKIEDGYDELKALDAISVAIQIYKSENFNLFSKDELAQMEYISQLFSASRTLYLGAYANSLLMFTEGVQAAELMLNGGEHYYKDESGDVIAHCLYYQFFPSSEAEVNQIVFSAGGASGHTAMRILQRVEDQSYPGGFKYTYTKVDAGLNCEHKSGMDYAIYTTEIRPKYKMEGDKYVELTHEEIAATSKNPELYEKLVKETIGMLISTEKQIQNYRKPSKKATGAAEEEFSVIGSDEANEWKRLNEIIKIARGKSIPGGRIAATLQRSGNCTMYNTSLAFGALLGMDEKTGLVNPKGVHIATDFMQQAKTYKYHTTLHKLYEMSASKGPNIMRLARSGEQLNGKDPMLEGIKSGMQFYGMHPIEWAFAENTMIYKGEKNGNVIRIEGKLPLAYCIEHRNDLTINGMNVLEYYVKYRLQSKDEMLANLKEAKIDLNDILRKDYIAEMGNLAPDANKIETLKALYDSLNIIESRVPIRAKSPIMLMLDTLPVEVIAENLAFDMKNAREVLIGMKDHCNLETAYKIDKVLTSMDQVPSDILQMIMPIVKLIKSIFVKGYDDQLKLIASAEKELDDQGVTELYVKQQINESIKLAAELVTLSKGDDQSTYNTRQLLKTANSLFKIASIESNAHSYSTLASTTLELYQSMEKHAGQLLSKSETPEIKNLHNAIKSRIKDMSRFNVESQSKGF